MCDEFPDGILIAVDGFFFNQIKFFTVHNLRIQNIKTAVHDGLFLLKNYIFLSTPLTFSRGGCLINGMRKNFYAFAYNYYYYFTNVK